MTKTKEVLMRGECVAFELCNGDQSNTDMTFVSYVLRPTKNPKPSASRNRLKYGGENSWHKSANQDIVLFNPEVCFERASDSLKALAASIQERPPTGKKLKIYTVTNAVVSELKGFDFKYEAVIDDSSVSLSPNMKRNIMDADIVAVVGQDQSPGACTSNISYLARVVADRGIPRAIVSTPDDCIIVTDGPHDPGELTISSWCTDRNKDIVGEEKLRG